MAPEQHDPADDRHDAPEDKAGGEPCPLPSGAIQTISKYLKTRDGDKTAVKQACLTALTWGVALTERPGHPALARGEHSAGNTDAQQAAALDALLESHGDANAARTLPPWLLPLLLKVLQIVLAVA